MERDMFTAGGYAIDTVQDLKRFINDPNQGIKPGEFVTIWYISKATLNQTFNASGYKDKNGNFYSKDDLEMTGRGFNKAWMNSFFDSDEYQSKVNVAKPSARNKVNDLKGAYEIKKITINWDNNKYNERKNAIADAMANASSDDIDSYIKTNKTFANRVNAYKMANPEQADEIDYYIANKNIPSDIIRAINNTSLKDGSLVDKDKSLFTTYSKNQIDTRESGCYYIIVTASDEVKQISQAEFYHLKKMFGKSNRNDISSEMVTTALVDTLNDIEGKYIVSNFVYDNILKMSFTSNGPDKKKVTFINREFRLPNGEPLDIESVNDTVMAESIVRRFNQLCESKTAFNFN